MRRARSLAFASLTAAVCLLLVGTRLTGHVLAQQPGAGYRLLDAAQSAVIRHPDAILQREQVDLSAGDVLAAAGAFDTLYDISVLRSRIYQPLLATQQAQLPGVGAAVANLTTFGLGVQRQFRSGLVITPSFDMNGSADNITSPGNARTRLAFDVTQPLMRGRGRLVVTGPERASREALAAAQGQERFVASGLALNAIAAYWTYLAAQEQVKIVGASEVRGRDLLSELQELVRAGRRPAADLKQMQADVANRTASRIATAQALIAARYDLGLAAGLTIDEMMVLPPAVDTFPDPPAALGPAWRTENLVQTALARRADLESARRQQGAAEALVPPARDALRPRADMIFSTGFSGLAESNTAGRFFRSPFDNVSGSDVTLGLKYQRPSANSAALGDLARTEARSRQASTQVLAVTRTIEADVRVAMSNVELTIERFRYVSEAASLFEAAVDDERTKLRIGLSTVLELLLTEDRFTQSQLQALGARASYARAVAQLRFETGTLLAADPAAPVEADRLRTLPNGE